MEPFMANAPPMFAGRPRILVVEDEIAIALEIEAELLDAGFDVVGPAADVEEAARLIVAGGIDAAILDVGLFGHSIEEAMGPLVERRIPFVFMTGYDEFPLPSWVPAAETVRKPCRMADLVDRVRSVVEGAPARAAAAGQHAMPDVDCAAITPMR
jgi:DNA-binding response OmpR family regulator